ncbi:MAG: metalloregulator ArsR/SmtB family transcription factor [Streptosporangiales bacterium]|nr:metalloregulator ArsR/SmtB family transcription factor [Streptosporangiales bacterium]
MRKATAADEVSTQPQQVSARPLDRDDAERLARLLKVVSDPTRLQLLSMISDSPSGEACVCDLTEPLGLRQPTVSHHLRMMVDAGILQREKRGIWAWYSIAPDRLAAIADILR